MNWRSVGPLLWPVLFVFVAGCVSHVRQPFTPSQVSMTPAPAGPFGNVRAPVDMVLEPAMRSRRGYTVQRFAFTATGGSGDRQVSGKLYSGRGAAPRPLLIVLPVWGISEYPSKKMTRDVLRRANGKIDVMLVDGRDYLIDWEALETAETEQQFLMHADAASASVRDIVIDVRRMVDWLTQREDIDPERIGIAGFSLSAVAASLVLLHEPRLATGVVVMGGSNPAEIFAVCAGRPGQVREKALERFGWSRSGYQNIFARAFEHGDPRSYTGRVADPSKLLFIEAGHDDCMTQQSRDDLWSALGEPERISFRFRHRGAFYAMTPLGFNVLGRYATAFLSRTLLAPEDAF